MPVDFYSGYSTSNVLVERLYKTGVRIYDDALKVAGIEITPTIERLANCAIEASVCAMKK